MHACMLVCLYVCMYVYIHVCTAYVGARKCGRERHTPLLGIRVSEVTFDEGFEKARKDEIATLGSSFLGHLGLRT